MPSIPVLQSDFAAVFTAWWQAMEEEMLRRWLSPGGPIAEGLQGSISYPWGLAFGFGLAPLRVLSPAINALQVFRDERIGSIGLFVHVAPQGGDVTLDLKRLNARTAAVESLCTVGTYPTVPASTSAPVRAIFAGSSLADAQLHAGDWVWWDVLTVGAAATAGSGLTAIVRYTAAADKGR